MSQRTSQRHERRGARLRPWALASAALLALSCGVDESDAEDALGEGLEAAAGEESVDDEVADDHVGGEPEPDTGSDPGDAGADDAEGAGDASHDEDSDDDSGNGDDDANGNGQDNASGNGADEASGDGEDDANGDDGSDDADGDDGSDDANGHDGSPDGAEDGSFRFYAAELPEATREAMTGVTWEDGCPVGLDDLRLIEVTHHGFDGDVHTGEVIAHAEVIEDLEQVFSAAFDDGFPLEEVAPAYRFGGDDDAIMEANASHVFNCRAITGGESWSEHSYGTAIDLNPRQNPYERDGTVLPPDGEPYLDRSERREGMLLEGDAVVEVFDELGWTWGARWRSLVDHMHFERPRS